MKSIKIWTPQKLPTIQIFCHLLCVEKCGGVNIGEWINPNQLENKYWPMSCMYSYNCIKRSNWWVKLWQIVFYLPNSPIFPTPNISHIRYIENLNYCKSITYASTHVRTYRHTYTHTHAHIHTHAYTRTHAHTDTYAHTDTHAHTCTHTETKQSNFKETPVVVTFLV